MDEANGESGTPPAGPPGAPGAGDGPAAHLVPGQRDPVTRPGSAPVRPPVPADGGEADPRAAARPLPRPATGPDGQEGLSDAELVAQVRGGRDSAYEELYRRHADAVRRYARTCCRDAHTAEDLAGEVFARTLQAIRGGSGPESAVRAYLLTTVRRVAASWSSTTRREQLVEDFALFAVSAAGAGSAQTTAELGADVRAMRDAERSLAVQAFRTLPERWQTVLWHTAVEDESPSQIAPMLGLTPNATAVLAHRAREGLRQAYLQAHVNSALTAEGACARFADRLGAHARGALRMRADRELNRHLKECDRCSAASTELVDLNSTLKGLLPVAYIGWFAAAAAKAAAAVAGGAAAAGAAGAGAGAAAATSSGGTGAAAASAAAAAEGLGAPLKAGVAAAVVVAATAATFALVLTGGHGKAPHHRATALPPAASPVTALPPAPAPAPAGPSPAEPSPRTSVATPPPLAVSKPSPAPTPSLPVSTVTRPAPTTTRTRARTPATGRSPRPTPTSTPTTPPAAPPPLVRYRLDSLPLTGAGDGSAPTIRPSLSPRGWWWDRWGLSVGGTRYAHGVTVHAPSELTIDLNRSCVAYDADVGVDDLARVRSAGVRFFVDGDGTRLWASGVVRGGDPAVPAHIGIAGYRTLTLRVTPVRGGLGLGLADLADWADAVISCR